MKLTMPFVRPKTVQENFRMKLVRFRRSLFVVAASLVFGSVMVGAVAQEIRGYDPNEAKSRLAQIGRALQIYRQEAGIKPVEEWTSPADAGLPPSLLYLATRGHDWSLPEGLATFKLKSLKRHVPNSASDFAHLYLVPGIELKPGDPYEEFPALMKQRGEQLPIMADHNFGSDDEHRKLLPRRFSIVLRINGKVEVVEHTSGSMDIFRR